MSQLAWIIWSAIGAVVLWLAYWFWRKGLALIKDDEVGIPNKKMFGAKMPEGQIIAGFLAAADINGDGIVDIFDLVIVGRNFGG